MRKVAKISSVLEGNNAFKSIYFKNNEKELVDLAKNGQTPKALFIGCADSRVVPSLITQTKPGDLFVLRNVGNFVAPYKVDEDYHSMVAGIEYVVTALNVSEIIICGHTECGAIASQFVELDGTKFVHMKTWLKLGEDAANMSKSVLGKKTSKEKLLRMTEELSVVFQTEHLLTCPCVKEGHGWVYNISTGEIKHYCPEERVYKSLEV